MTGAAAPKHEGVTGVVDLGRFVASRKPRAMMAAITLLVLASLTEGFSLLLLLPILKLLDPRNPDIALQIPTGPFAGFLGEKLALGLGTVLSLFVLVITLRAVLMAVKDIFNTSLMYGFINDLRNELFESVTRARWAFLAQLRGADVDHALTADIDRVHSSVAMFMQLVQSIVLLVVYGGVAVVISPRLSLFAGLVGVVLIGGMAPMRRLATRFGRTLTEQRREQYRVVNEFIGGVKVAKAFKAEPLYVGQLSTALATIRSSTIHYMRILSVSRVFFQILSASGLALVIYLSVMRYGIDFGAIVALVFIFIRIAPRATAIHTVWQGLLSSIPALDAILNLKAQCDHHREPEASADWAPQLTAEIAFRHVGFSYVSSDRTILSDVDFVIPANQITAIVGSSGAGKSTIADLLMGLLEPTAGNILVDGVRLTAERRRAWRGLIGYVPQDTFLLHDSLAANLRFGRRDIDEQAMWEALRIANADQFVRNMPEGLATVLGDRGVRLSGGERQRVALARALLRQPRLLLLDEATSALDWESQATIARAIEGLRGRMTVVTIAHRPSMIAFADWVVAIEGGRVVQTGEYRALASIRGGYFHQILAGDSALTDV